MLRSFSKIVSYATLFLIFVGGMVTSTGSGLAVPDWPLSYGTLFPPMIGGVFYEHGHRMAASFVGFLTLVLTIWIAVKENRLWVKMITFCALGAVILQGILGGLTVLFFLPTPISVAHGVLAQTFFLLTIFIAFSLSNERSKRVDETISYCPPFIKMTTILLVVIYIQLILGALMRHTGSRLAISDFPKMGGLCFPNFSNEMMFFINHWRFEQNLDSVEKWQVAIHLTHRIGAGIILLTVCALNIIGLKWFKSKSIPLNTLFLLDFLIAVQISLGITTILMLKAPIITSLHVVTGAGLLGVTFLLFLRSSPAQLNKFKTQFNA